MQTKSLPKCTDCQYFRGAKGGMCDAFPQKIPDKIWSGDFMHDKPFPGDRGIRFHPKEGEFWSVTELARALNVAPKTVLRVAIYARVSIVNKGQDVGLQLRDLRSHARSRGVVIFREYVDNGISGRKDRRPELDVLMNDARKKRFDTVLVWRFDRFARSTKHLVTALDEFKHLGIDFISYQENIDTSSPMGKAMFTIVSAIAELEADIIKERVVAGMANARAKGVKLGRPSPNFDRDELVALRDRGLTIRAIAERLNLTKSFVHKSLLKCCSQTLVKSEVESLEMSVQ